MHPSLNQVDILNSDSLSHVTVPHGSKGCQRKSVDVSHYGGSNPKGCLSREGAAITEDFTDGASEMDCLSDCGHFATKVCLLKALIFPVVMYGCESWTMKKAEH